ncbi:choice-of-anchor Q domain-containing protein [Neptunitalea lumnitzerae]|uniref:Right handed beta helix domain-containing protein n=1 Tax=Neptunitalea lumnitzerae TaxID=2965509 RepID=A0ABQ5MJW9_9FLAO|nr:choice-of-anchor Q domain-containing protein [Neptunitalea sp. Y10]GLB49601.1 hypothetical protein Y10_19690 [Neptunitalea sp. Y10]
MKKNYLYLIFTLITSISFAQTNLNFTINNAIDYGGTGGMPSSDYRIEETINTGGDTYLLKITSTTDLVLEELTTGSGDYVFYGGVNNHSYQLFKNGNVIAFNFISLDFDNPFDEAAVSIENHNGDLITPLINAGGTTDGFVSAGTILPTNTSNATNITEFIVNEEISGCFNDVGWHNIQIQVPNTGNTISPDTNNIIYVNKNVSGGSGNGSSWGNAVSELADALTWAHNNQDTSWATTPLQIWVAAGTYNPLYSAEDGGNFGTEQTKDNTFLLVKDVQVYGNFDGTETSLTDRDVINTANATILSGDIGTLADYTDNTYHIVLGIGDLGLALLDGFTVTNGIANGSGSISVNGQPVNRNYGGAMFFYNNASPSISNTIITTNNASGAGGGIFCSTSSNPTLSDVTIIANTCNDNGGGIYLNNSSPILNNVTLDTNTAVNLGGGIYAYNYSDYSISNSNLTGNAAGNNGGGMYNFSASPNIINVTFYNNTASTGNGGGMLNFNASPPLTNVVFSYNMAANHGGAMYNDNNSAPDLLNTAIYKNSAFNGNGGGIYNNNASSDLTNVTLANNSASGSGSGFYNVNSSFDISNSILWDTFSNTNSYTNNSYSLIQTSSNTSNGNIDATGLSITDIFTDPTNDDFTLLFTSPAVNVGSTTMYTNAGGDINTDTDVLGNTRFFDIGIDLGAYEFQETQMLPDSNNILYVNINVSGGTGNGSSWANAVPELADALKWARIKYDLDNTYFNSTPLQIYVAEGTYYPLYNAADNSYTSNGNRDNSFVLVKNVQLYGGFDPDNGITDLTHTRITPTSTSGTVLSGDIGTLNDNSDNSLHVFISSGDIGAALLNGFTITKGNSDGSTSMTVNSNIIVEDCGAGILNYNSSPSFNNVVITDNDSGFFGAGVDNRFGSPNFTNVTISNNIAAARGGGIYNYNATPIFINNLIVDNTSSTGGGIYNDTNANISLINTTISDNTHTYIYDSSGIYNDNSISYITNCIIWNSIYNEAPGSYTSTNSLIQNSSDTSNGNIDATGLTEADIFTDATNGNYTPLNTSVVANAGSNTAYTNAGGDLINDTDLAGNPRLINPTIDLGAYENQVKDLEPDANNIIYVNTNVTGGTEDGSSWANAVPQLADALKWARTQFDADDTSFDANPLKIYIAQGTYYPLYNAADASYITNGNRDNSFVLVKNVQLYGGFDPDNGITDLTHTRITPTTVDGTILSGDIGVQGSNSDNVYHVVIASGDVNTALLDGVTITDGNGVTSYTSILVNGNTITRSAGGGMNCKNTSPLVNNVLINNNRASEGAGMYNNNNANPTLTNVTISNNISSGSNGGGIQNWNASATLTKVIISGNTALRGGGIFLNDNSNVTLTEATIYNNNSTSGPGAGIYCSSSTLSLRNVSFTNNTANTYGGGLYCSYSTLNLRNVVFGNNSANSSGGGIYTDNSNLTASNITLSKNTAIQGPGGIYKYGGSTTINNSIIYGNTSTFYNNNIIGALTTSYCLIEDETSISNGNIDATGITLNDIFTDPTNGDYTLKYGSPAVNTGSNTAYTNAGGDLTNDTDLAGNPRYAETAIDIGAYEFQGIDLQPDANNILYVNINVSGGTGDGSSWANAAPQLADALKWAHNNQDTSWATTPLQIWVAGGTYNPLYSAEDGSNFGTNQTRDNTFLLVENVQVYGSFIGTETNLSDRNITSFYTSMLNGDIGTLNDATDNTYHVVVASGNTGTALLNGFQIINGNANGSGTVTINGQNIAQNYGGGSYAYNNASPSLTNITISNNNATGAGGGIFNALASSPILNTVEVSNNTSGDNGGGIYNNNSSPTLTNVTISNNTAITNGGGVYNYNYADVVLNNVTITNNTATNGGGLMNYNSSPNIRNAFITDNTAISNGGGMLNQNNSNPTLTNVLIAENGALDGAGIYNNSSSSDFINVTLVNNSATNNGNGFYNNSSIFTITNSIIWDNVFNNGGGSYTINYYNLILNSANTNNGNLDATGISIADIFEDAANGNYNLASGSIAIDAGNNSSYSGNIATDTDLVGNLRVYNYSSGGVIDMGAFESLSSAPVVNCQSITVYLDANGEATITPSDIDNGSWDAEGSITLSLDITYFDCSDLGDNTVTLTAEDIDGFVTTCNASVTVEDNLLPTPNVITLSDITAQCELVAADITTPTATDNCSTVTVTSNATFPITTNTVITWTYTDASGNYTTQTQNVVIDDTTAPVADSTTLTDIIAQCEVVATDVTTPSATDNCSSVTVTNDASFPITASTVITWTYTDASGNYTTQTQNVVIDDTTAPVADSTTLADIIAQCEVVATDVTTPSATDNCSSVTVTSDATFPITANTVITWTYTDASGNYTTQSQLINITNDTTNPIPDSVSLADITAGCNVLESDVPVPTATDNCSTVTVTNDATFPITASTVITWTYTDASGNYTTQTQNIVISGITVPTPNVTTLNDITAQCEVLESDITIPSATNICGGTVMVTSDTTFPITASTVITWTYTNNSGNFSTQTQNVIIDDSTAPVADNATLADIEAQCEVNKVDVPDPTATDNCSTVTVTSDATFPITASTVITWTYTDASGNYTTQTQNVVIDDTTAPIADSTTLADITAQCEVLATDVTTPSATDNCSTVTVTSNTTFPITASTVITWTYTDASGNYTTQTQNVVIDDTTAPTPDVVNLPSITMQCEVLPIDIPTPTATDNCSTVTVTSNASFPITASTVITWTYTDASGNYTTQPQNVIIDDTTAPVADSATLADITAQCEVNKVDVPDPTATDNCSTVTVTSDASFPITASTVITWTYTDASGNYTTQTQNVVIDDTTAPVADSATLADIIAQCEVLATDVTTPSATDNCSSVTVTSDTTFPITASTVITWTYTDASGNYTTQTQNVIIDDTTAPIADNATLADIIAQCEVLATDVITPSATDNCSTVTVTSDASFPITASTVITWTYTDASGNYTTQTQNVVIDDTTAPIADSTTLADITAQCEVLATDVTTPSATDNCSSVTVNSNATFPITASTVITWTYTDASGNYTTQTQNVIIDDTTAPIADNATLADITAQCEVLATDVTTPSATDNCSSVTVTSDATFPITAQGTTMITWTYTDASGNYTTQTQNVVIDDTTAPVADSATLADIIAQCEVLATDVTTPSATDNCSTVTVTSDATFPITANTVITWTYTDASGNYTTQTQNVVIDDTTAPIADSTTLADITAQCEVIATDVTTPSATDNCSTVTVTSDATFPITASTVITWTYTDASGNYTTQTQNVVIDDTTAPVADSTTLTDIIAQCEVLATNITTPTATDNCSSVTVTSDATFPITASTVITWTYTDASGNYTTQTQNVIIDDTTTPVADDATLADITAQCEVLATDVTIPTATDNCSSVTVTSDATFPITASTVITWTYTDASGNYTTQTQNVVIDDTTAPIADSATLADITAQCEVLATDVTTPSATDNCSTVTVTSDATFPITASTVITWTYTDASGNYTIQTQNVVIDDTTAPVADNATLADITAQCEVLATDVTTPSATDNCSTVTVTSDATFPITAQGTTIITWTYTDTSGNYTTQTQNVIIDDTTAPIADSNTLADITAQCEVLATDVTMPSATDNCSTVTVTSDATFPITAQGTTMITWTYTDASGNYTTQTQNIVIDDTTAPIADSTTLVGITAQCEVLATDVTMPSATDNCSSVTVTSDATFPITASTVITWTYTDASGNYTTQTQNVVIDDTTAPVADSATLADITAQCEVLATDVITPSATDNCSTVTVTSDASFPITAQGTTMITWTYTDAIGNYTLQTQNVIIDDTTAPVANNATLADITAQCEVLATDVTTPSATDNCSSVTVTSDATFPITASTVITWTYTDASGNYTTQTQNVVIDDTIAPIADSATLADITAQCEVVVTDVTTPSATDNCSTVTVTSNATFPITASTVITWTYTDASGNYTTQTQNVVIDDTTAPVADSTTLADITAQCEVIATDVITPSATDNCSSVTVTNDATFPITASTVITWTYTDASGNYTTQTQNVVIDDTTAPIADSATLADITAQCEVLATDVTTPSATDNCSSVTVTSDVTFPITAQGTTMITWTYTDASGNYTTQTQNVVIDDTTAPTPDVNTLPSISMQCEVLPIDIPTPTATDNCTGIVVGTTNDPLSYTTVGSYTITWTFDDGHNNSTTQTQTINVIDSALDTATFTDVTYTYNGLGQYIAVDNLPTGATVSYSILPNTGLNNGAIDAGTYVVTAVLTPAPNAPNCTPVTLTANLIIEQASQQINFDVLPIKHLENDVDFQLTATSSSGLPVYYTYTYTATNATANVTATGWVEMLTSGSVFITAHQDGDSNYLPAANVTQEQVIISSDASIHAIVIDGETYDTPNDNIFYLMECNNTADEITITITTEANATSDVGHEFTISTPKPGIYNEVVTITSQDGTTTNTYYITIERMFQFFDIVEQKFDNVLLANNNPATNDGYSFVAYEWYVNDQLISTDQYFSVGPDITDLLDDTATYYLRLTTIDGAILQTCESAIILEHDYSMRVTPNPVKFGKQINVLLDLPKEELDQTMIIIYDLYGKQVFTTRVSEMRSVIQLPKSIQPAPYLLKCINPNREKTFKIIVQ